MTPDEFRARNLKRSPLFVEIADWMLGNIPGIRIGTYFRPETPILLSHAYFLISDAYKAERRQSTRTDKYKIAAISAISIMAVRPFEPLIPEEITENSVLFANPIYAIAVANAWATDRYILEKYTFDYLRRFYISLLAIEMPSLQEFLHAANEGDDVSHFQEVKLSWKEMALIESWIEKMWHLVNHRM